MHGGVVSLGSLSSAFSDHGRWPYGVMRDLDPTKQPTSVVLTSNVISRKSPLGPRKRSSASTFYKNIVKKGEKKAFPLECYFWPLCVYFK